MTLALLGHMGFVVGQGQRWSSRPFLSCCCVCVCVCVCVRECVCVCCICLSTCNYSLPMYPVMEFTHQKCVCVCVFVCVCMHECVCVCCICLSTCNYSLPMYPVMEFTHQKCPLTIQRRTLTWTAHILCPNNNTHEAKLWQLNIYTLLYTLSTALTCTH